MVGTYFKYRIYFEKIDLMMFEKFALRGFGWTLLDVVKKLNLQTLHYCHIGLKMSVL